MANSTGGTFTSGAGNTSGVPIYNSYLTNRDPINIEVASLEEFETGSIVNLVFYAVGDATNQDGRTTITYNGVASDVIETDNENDVDGNFDPTNAFASFQFTKVDGVDSFSISSNGTNRNRGFNAFSLTGTSPTVAVPEPSSALAIAFVGGLAMLRRRRK